MTETSSAAGVPRPAWNKGKITGPKPPLRPSHVWAIRASLDLDKPTRDLAMFNLAIDSKLRGCDLVALRVGDVAPNGYAKDRANVRQQKTGRPVRFELTEPTRDAVDSYLRMTNRKAGEYLFRGGRNLDRPLSTRQDARLAATRVGGIRLHKSKFATHSLRRYAESGIMPRLLPRAPVAWTYIMALAGSSA